uniref:Apple domain-containing protein n=1 Tax=Panagrolaimus sp. PS1159 TaxID=55785 RepID=A0AC35GMA6_9BILA
MENGIIVFETPQKWGTNCYQTVYCSARGELNTDLVAITVTQVDGTMSEAASGCCGQNISVELECGGNGVWSFPGLPEYPLTPTIICEGWISNNNNNNNNLKTPLPITTTTPTPTKSCVGCHGLIPGHAYRRDMENGILVFETKKAGLNFSQTVYCSARGNLCTDLVSITVTQVDGTMSEAANGACGQNISIDLECGGNNEWFFPGVPEYPLKPTIICEGSIQTTATSRTSTMLPVTSKTTPKNTNSIQKFQNCSDCQDLVPGPSYTRNMENGIAVFETTKSGLNCSQTVYCSARGKSSTDLVSITVMQVDGTISVAAEGSWGQNISITLECGGNNEWFFPGVPEYPLKPTIICEGSIPKKPFSTICNKGGFQQLSATANTSISTLGHFGGYFVTLVACQQLCKKNYQEKCFGYMYEAKNRGTCTIFTVPINYNIYETRNSKAVIFRKCSATSPTKKPLPFNVSGNS